MTLTIILILIIFFSQKIEDFTVNFDLTGFSNMVRLTVNQCDLGANTNAVINEVIIGNFSTLLFSLYKGGGL